MKYSEPPSCQQWPPTSTLGVRRSRMLTNCAVEIPILAMLWLKFRGVRWYDLGGINPDSNLGGIVGVVVAASAALLRQDRPQGERLAAYPLPEDG